MLKPDPDKLEDLIAEHDAWLRQNNIVSPFTHNTIVLNLYAQFPVKYLEYEMDIENKTVNLILYMSFWRALFTRKGKLLRTVLEMFKEYLPDYKVAATVAYYSSQIRLRQTKERLEDEKSKQNPDLSTDLFFEREPLSISKSGIPSDS
jgi:predicted transglutaminase-like protease